MPSWVAGVGELPAPLAVCLWPTTAGAELPASKDGWRECLLPTLLGPEPAMGRRQAAHEQAVPSSQELSCQHVACSMALHTMCMGSLTCGLLGPQTQACSQLIPHLPRAC